jgi:aromatic-L-amino-acid/L-tryptophan decarboxylase
MGDGRTDGRTDSLGLDVGEMRALAHWVADAVVDHYERIDESPAIRTAGLPQLQAALGGPPPLDPQDPLESLQVLIEHGLANMQHGDHPRYFARIPGPSSFAGVLGDWLASGFNAIASSWAGGSGPAAVELVVLEWLRSLLGLPDGTEGVLVSGGSNASLTALIAARACGGPGVAYLSDQTHASIARGLRAAGFPPEQIRVLGSDERFRLPPAALAAAAAADRAAGRRPGFVVATAGTTNTGAVDPLGELAEICAAEGMWLHVDGAYGAPAALTARGRPLLDGLERADSLALDPHKWLFSPYDVGCLLVTRQGALAQAFRMTPEYLADATGADGDEVDLRDRTLELTRRARALKLWMLFRVYGVRRIVAAIERGIELAEHAQRLLEADPRWELVTPAQLAIVTFALAGDGEADRDGDGARAGARAAGPAAADLHAVRAAAVAADGYAAVTSTTLRGRSVLRLCTINPLTTEDELAETLERLASG